VPTPREVLKQYWGYSGFRPLQEEIIQSVLEGRDTLALMPTGGGKSICFQVPALVREGVCVVVSPLIALMKDQVRQLKERGIRAEAIYSGLRYQDIDRILDNAVFGHLKFLYLSPERLKTDLLIERLPRMPVNLLAVDEAHCISQWGYDFRPPYLEIPAARELLPAEVPILAVTATATPEVVNDIQDKLAFRPPARVMRKSFARDNLAYVVRRTEAKEPQLVDILAKVPGTAVVYARNRRKCKEIATHLYRLGIPASYYHAGLDMEERSQRQDAWIKDQVRVMVATNAFGMGIDKADVRLVVHLDLPDNLEAYFQEAGRAGRDGKKAFAVLLYNDNDRHRLERNFELSFPELSEIRRVYRALGSYLQLATGAGAGQSFDFDLVAFAETFQLSPIVVHHCLKVLEQSGWIMVTEAVYIPARLLIKVNKDQLYDFQLRHPKLDRVLKAIMRAYQGAMSDYITVRERQLAQFINISMSALRQALQTMHQHEIIDYQPAKNQPQLIFLQDRVDADDLTIDLPAYRFRKERHAQRMQAAIAYASTDVCRSQQLLGYFGEKDPPACGICDVCLARKKKALENKDYDHFQVKAKALLVNGPKSLAEVVAAFPEQEEEDVLDMLTFMVNEGMLQLLEGQLSIP
jgi:ATP-dependent DNA helicase RecQ